MTSRIYEETYGSDADKYFLSIADLLESGQLHSFANEETILSIKNDKIPKELMDILESSKDLGTDLRRLGVCPSLDEGLGTDPEKSPLTD